MIKESLNLQKHKMKLAMFYKSLTLTHTYMPHKNTTNQGTYLDLLTKTFESHKQDEQKTKKSD